MTIQRTYQKDLQGLLTSGSPCEVCDRPPRDHEWMDLDENGFAVHCSFLEKCHCGQPIFTHIISLDGETFSRGLCKHCDEVRCDAYPGACRDDFDGRAFDGVTDNPSYAPDLSVIPYSESTGF